MGEEFMAVTFSTFGAGGINRPHYWPDLSTKYQKSIKYYGRPKLILTGELSTSINIIALTAQGVEVGTDVEYARKQQYGSGYLPARPYFPVMGDRTNPELTDYARARIEARIMRDLLRLGLG
jgi:phage gpG-like protein